MKVRLGTIGDVRRHDDAATRQAGGDGRVASEVPLLNRDRHRAAVPA